MPYVCHRLPSVVWRGRTSAAPTRLVDSFIVAFVAVRTLRYAITFLHAHFRVAGLTFERAGLLGALASFGNH